jgi:predicted nucleic acid-binding protein
MSWIVDASVAAKWFFDEDLTEKARALIGTDRALIAPDLILPEVCSVVWKRVLKREATVEQAHAVAKALPEILSLIVPSAEVLTKALQLSIELRHSIYDSMYLALAESRDIVFVTADRKLLAAQRRGKWPGKAVHLSAV